MTNESRQAAERVPLTDDEIESIGHRTAHRYRHAAHYGASVYEFRLFTLLDFARAIERAHGIGPQGPNSEAPAK